MIGRAWDSSSFVRNRFRMNWTRRLPKLRRIPRQPQVQHYSFLTSRTKKSIACFQTDSGPSAFRCMTFINYASREINCKIVYYGPRLCGETTNLQYIFDSTAPQARGKLISLATETD